MKNSMRISKILVFSEESRNRIFVGELRRHPKGYSFVYDESFMARASATPLGPDLPFSLQPIESKAFFASLADLVPSRANPAYETYCRSVGMDPDEADPMVLLAFLGKGPSAFRFEPAPRDEATSGGEIAAFRKSLGLSQRQLATFFDLPVPTLQAVEKEAARAQTARRLIQVFRENPKALAWLLVQRGMFLGDQPRRSVELYLEQRFMARASYELGLEKQVRALGHVEWIHAPAGLKKRWTQLELLAAAQQAECFKKGQKPEFKYDGIEMKREVSSGGYDEWSLTCDGGFYGFRVFIEDRKMRPKKSDILYVDTRVEQIAEALEQAKKLYAALEVSSTKPIKFKMTHRGIADRYLTSNAPLRADSYPRKKASEDLSRWEGLISLKDLSKGLNDYILEISNELFSVFDGWAVSKEKLEKIIGEFFKQKM